jgi:hypothetical protein
MFNSIDIGVLALSNQPHRTSNEYWRRHKAKKATNALAMMALW